MAGDAAAPLPPAGFEVVRRGYDQEQVEAHLRRLDAEMRILATDRDAAVDQSAQLTRELDDSRARAERLRAQVRTLVSPQQSVQGMSERMRSMLRMAEDEVAEMLQRADNEVTKNLHDAEQKAAGIVEEARAEADAIRMQSKAEAEAAEEADTRRRAELEAAESAHHERLAAGRETAEREIAEARARLAAEQKEHAEAATLADADADRRRSDAWTESENRRQSGGGGLPHRDGPTPQGSAHRAHGRAARHAHGHRGDARARARRGQADGRGRAGRKRPGSWPTPEAAVGRLREQRQRIVGQLAASRADLDQLVAALGPLPGEQDSEQATPPSGSPVVQPSPAFTPTPHPR